MSKLKLKKVKEHTNCDKQHLESVKNNINPVSLQTSKSIQQLFVDKTQSNCAPNGSTIKTIKLKDHLTSKYFITSSLSNKTCELDESEVEFQPDRRPKRKAVIYQKETKKKKKPLRKKDQKDIRDVINSKKDDLSKYTQAFEKECMSAGIDVNPEHLQVAIALSRSITDFQNNGDQNYRNLEQNAEVELTPSQEKVFEQKRIKQIRKTLDEFGFKVQRTFSSTNVKANTKRKLGKGHTNFPLLTKSQEEKAQRISDSVSQILFETVSLHCSATKSHDTPCSLYLSDIWCNCSCTFTKSGHAYANIKDNSVYYTSDLIKPSKSEITCLLRDWNSIPGREKSPTRSNHNSLSFRESYIYLNNFDVLLSGTYSMISTQSNKKMAFDSSKVIGEDHTTSDESIKCTQDMDVFSNSKLIQEIYIDKSRCSSPDIFEDDSYISGIFTMNNQDVESMEQNIPVIIADSSDDDLPRIYITKSQKDLLKTLPNISEDCDAINTSSIHEESENIAESILDSNKIHEKSIDLTQDDSDNYLPNQNLSFINDSEEIEGNTIDIKNSSNDKMAVKISNDKNSDVSFDLTQNDAENIVENVKFELDIDQGDKIKESSLDVIHNIESGESVLNISENLDLSGVYEGRNGIMHYESFQTSPFSSTSIRKSQEYHVDSSSDNCDEDMFETTQKQNMSYNKSIKNTKDPSFLSDCKESIKNSSNAIDLTQSSKDSDVSLSPSYSTNSSVTKRHVSSQSMLTAKNLTFSANTTANLTMASIDSNEVLKYYNEIVHDSSKDIGTPVSPKQSCANLSVSYSSNENNYANCTNDTKLDSNVNKTSNLSISNNEFSSESSAYNDVFVISDEEFNYSISTPYNKNNKCIRKKLIKNENLDNKNCNVSKNENESPDLSMFPISREVSKVAPDNTYGPAYSLNLCGSSLFDRIPSCNSSLAGNLVQNNTENVSDISTEKLEYNTPSTSKSTFNIYKSIDRKTFKENSHSVSLASDSRNLCTSIDDHRVSKICDFTPDNSKYLIEVNNVTPAQDFNEMDTPKMIKELSKFGLKPLKRKRAIQLLDHIYNETHQFLPAKLPQNKRRKLKDEDDFTSSTPIQLKIVLHNLDEGNYIEHIEPKKMSQNASEETNALDESLNSQNTETISEDKSNIYNPDCGRITIKEINCNSDDWIFQNREKTKVHGCRVPLHIAFHNYLSVRNKLRDAILSYEPINIDTIHRGLVSEGYRYNTKDLFHFMDKKCITIKTTDKNVATKGQKKR